MKSRPVDSSGDILPVTSLEDLSSGPEAAAAGLRDHLNLFPGDWWENPEAGNPILDLLALGRNPAQDVRTFSACIADYLLTFPDVQSVKEISTSVEGRIFSYSATVRTGRGDIVPLSFAAP